jgi:hypothetical protein
MAALVRVMDQPWIGSPPGEAHLELVHYELGAHMLGHEPTIWHEKASWTAAR